MESEGSCRQTLGNEQESHIRLGNTDKSAKRDEVQKLLEVRGNFPLPFEKVFYEKMNTSKGSA